MQKSILISEVNTLDQYLEADITEYIHSDVTETFEEFENFDLLSFDWYDSSAEDDDLDSVHILIYIDKDDLFFMCRDTYSLEHIRKFIPETSSNEKTLYSFFVNLLKNDMDVLEDYEAIITDAEDNALSNKFDDYLDKIITYRKELLALKHYYEQLADLFDNICINDNHIFTDDGIRHFGILANRTARLLSQVQTLRDYVTQMREAYQSQIDFQQNDIMRVFTVITGVFMPLTLLVGWYGMNFTSMKELNYKYSYPIFCFVCLIIVTLLIRYFKKKKWF